MVHGFDNAVRADGAGVEQIPIEMGKPDKADDFTRSRRDRLEAPFGSLQETGTEQKILRRVTRHRELGEEHDVRASGFGLLDACEDPLAVSVEIADGRVDLGKREPHGSEDSDSEAKSRYP